ncbi:MAG: kinase [Clostridia bacterium]|nr:kinase [Clostridia bacterium]
MGKYGLNFIVPDSNVPFEFILIHNGNNIGFRFEDFNGNDNVNMIISENDVKFVVIIHTWKSGIADKWIDRDNSYYQKKGISCRSITLENFFEHYLNHEEWKSFSGYIDQYLKDIREITGFKSIRFLSSMNLASQKIIEEKQLADWDYTSYTYQIIDPTKDDIKKFLYLSDKHSEKNITRSNLEKIKQQYIDNGLYKTMIGRNSYAQSFTTSEWLFDSLKDRTNFDYTAVICGYLKSVEQLLYTIVMLNLDNNCKITMLDANTKSVKKQVEKKGIKTYQRDKEKGIWYSCKITDKGYKYIDLIAEQKTYIKSDMGTFEHFLRYNPHIFIDPSLSETIADMVSCFRAECRNGYFHLDNLTKWEDVKKTRSNAFYLYYVLLGSCILPESRITDLGFIKNDSFDKLCTRIRDFAQNNIKFIFEYVDGRRLKLVYDFQNNTIEFAKDGIEHYENLLFYKVEDFETAFEQLDEGIHEEQKVYLTRDNLPTKVYGIHRNNELEEIAI